METTIFYRDYMGIIQGNIGRFWDDGKENGNYCLGFRA